MASLKRHVLQQSLLHKQHFQQTRQTKKMAVNGNATIRLRAPLPSLLSTAQFSNRRY